LKIEIPFALFASKDEDTDKIERFGVDLRGEKPVRNFSNMGHG